MKKLTSIIILTSLIGCLSKGEFKKEKQDQGLNCTLTLKKNSIKLGQIPEIQVKIQNNSGQDWYLIGSLDDSEFKLRYPYCKLLIEKPQYEKMEPVEICGVSNTLRFEDFQYVNNGESFNPYKIIDEYGYWGSSELRKENFKYPGKYKLQFLYSTKSRKFDSYLGTPNALMEKWYLDSLRVLVEKVPKIELASNILELEIKE